MAELADVLDLGSNGNSRAGSSPVTRTISSVLTEPEWFCMTLGFFYCFFSLRKRQTQRPNPVLYELIRCFQVSFQGQVFLY